MKNRICNHKSCIYNNQPQPISNFYKWSYSPDGYAYICKTCNKKIRKERSERNKDIKVDPQVNSRVCTSSNCTLKGIEQPLINFFKDKKGQYGYGNTCKDCEARRWEKRKIDPISKAKKQKVDKVWRENNKEKKKETDRKHHERTWRKYYDTNSEALKTKAKEYSRDNRKKITAKRNLRKKQDINYLLSERLRIRLYHGLKGKVKGGSAVKDLGCELPYLKSHLEMQFYANPLTNEQMNWDNYCHDGWHVDHIVPMSAFNLQDEEECRSACHFSNLRPMWSKENIARNKESFARSKNQANGKIHVKIIDEQILIEKEIRSNWPIELMDPRNFTTNESSKSKKLLIALNSVLREQKFDNRIQSEIIEPIYPEDEISISKLKSYLEDVGILKTEFLNDSFIHSFPFISILSKDKKINEAESEIMPIKLKEAMDCYNNEYLVVIVLGYVKDHFIIWDTDFSFIQPFVWWPANDLLKRSIGNLIMK